MIKAILNALNALLLVATTGFLAAWQLGEWSPRSSPPTQTTQQNPHSSSHRAATDTGRVFVLFIESLRDETARNPELMPYLTSLINRSLHGTLQTVYDAATEPALIAAFTGKKQNKALGALRIYFNPSGHIESLFTSAKEHGLRSVIYSDYLTFSIFRQDFSERRRRSPSESTSSFAPSYTALPEATQNFVDGGTHLVIYHIDELEAVAHKQGITHQDYKEVAQTLDQLIREVDERISPHDFLLIFGDHGHTPQGRHSFGLDVPTYFVLRGPQVVNQQFPLSPLTIIHHLVTTILKIPRSPDYTGPHWSPFTLHDYSASSAVDFSPPTPPSQRMTWSWLLVSAGIGICGMLWHQANQFISRKYGSRVGTVTTAPSPSTLLVSWILAALLGVLFLYIGIFLSNSSSLLKDPPLHIIFKFWLVALLFMLLSIPRRSPAFLGLTVFLVPFFLLVPNFYRFGAPGVFAPAWILWTLGMGKFAYHQFRFKHRPFPLPVLYMMGILIYILQLFFLAEGQRQTNNWFIPLIAQITPTSVFIRSLLGAFAGYFLIYRRHGGVALKTTAWIFALYILLVQTQIVPHGGPVELATAATLLVSSILWSHPLKMGRYFKEPYHFSKAIYLISLIVLSFEALRLNLDARVNLLFLFSAVRLSILIMEKILGTYRSKENHILFLNLVGFVGVGWLTLGWGFSRIDLGPLFDYVPPELVGRKMGHFLPLILVRFALPIVVLRTLVQEACPRGQPFPSTHLGLILGTKYLSLLLIVMGIGFDQPGSFLYFEAVAQLGVFLVLSFGFL